MKVFTKELTNPNTSLTVYIPDYSEEMSHLTARRSILVIPGGGYRFCSDREAEPIAMKFLGEGFAAFVLRYSLNEDSAFPKPLDDAVEALKYIRANAEDFMIDPQKISVIGFSAGGHLAAAVSTMPEERPNAQILGYPCILEEIGDVLACPVPSLEKEVDDRTPPAFIFAAAGDDCVPIKHSIEYSRALSEKKIPFEMHIFANGGHGFSTAEASVYSWKEGWKNNKYCEPWFDLCIRWLDTLFPIYTED